MAQISIPKFPSTSRELTYSDFSGGLNYKNNASLLKSNQSPEAINIRIRDGTISKRSGYSRLYPTSLGAGQINGIGIYRKANGSVYRLICHSANIFTQSVNSQPVLLKSGIANARATFFTLSDKFYILNGVNFLTYDGSTCVDVVGYVPKVLVGRSPSGSPNAGTVSESFNNISPGFRTSFSATGTATAYTLPYTSLDATVITAIVNGVSMVETTNFTVNRTTGVVTFNIAPTIGTDNVIITAFKASLTTPALILNCKHAEVYGGKSEATVFFSGNPNYPDLIWHSRLYGENYNADYFPDDAVQKVPGNVAGLAHIFDLLYISHSKGHGYLSYADGTAYPIFPYADINLEKGSDIPGSIQEVNNAVICASTSNGVMQVLSNTTVNDRLSVNDISDLVNKSGSGRTDLGILQEGNLTNAVSYNHDGYYGLCINDVCYVWDYKLNAWLFDTNIPASCFAVIDNTLCFGSNTDGIVYQFDPLIANDDGVAIDAWYDLREECAGTPNMIKVINKIGLLAKPMSRGSTLVSFRSRRSNSDVVLTMQTSAFSFVGFNFVNFTFNTSFFPVLKRKRMSKRANYFQFRFGNNVLDEGMSVISLNVQYDQGSEVR